MLGWTIEEKAMNLLKSFDKFIDEQFDWIIEAIVEVKKALTEPDIHLLPKTPSEKKKRLRQGKMGSRSAFTYHCFSNEEPANLRGSYAEIDVLSPRTPEGSSKEINIRAYGKCDSFYDSGQRQSFQSEKDSQVLNHMPPPTSFTQRNGVCSDANYFPLNRHLYAELCLADISSNQHSRNGFNDLLHLFDDCRISESVDIDCKGCDSVSSCCTKNNCVILPKCELQNIFSPEIVETLLPCTSNTRNGSILIQNLVRKVDETRILKSLVLTFTRAVQSTECGTSLCDLSIKGNVSHSLFDSNNCLPNGDVEARGSNRFLLDHVAPSEVLQNTSDNENSVMVSLGVNSVVCENSEMLADKAISMPNADPNRGIGPNFSPAKFCGVQRISDESGSGVERAKEVTKKRRSKSLAKSRRSSIIPGRKYVSQRQSSTKSKNLRKSREKGKFYFSGKSGTSSNPISHHGSRQENDEKMVSFIPDSGRLYRSPAVNSIAVKPTQTSVPKSRIQKLCRLFSPKSKAEISRSDTSCTTDLAAVPTSSSAQTFSSDKTAMKKSGIDKACVNKNSGPSINGAFSGRPKHKPSAFVHCFSSPRRSSSIENARKSKHQDTGFNNKTKNRFVKTPPITKALSTVGAVEKSSANGLFRRLQGKVKPSTREPPSAKSQALSVRAKLSEKKSGSVFLTAGHVGNAEIANVSVVEKAASFDEQEICQLVKDCYFLQLASNIPVPLVASSDTVLSYDIGDIASDSDSSSAEDLDTSRCKEAPPRFIPLWAHGKRLASTIIEVHLSRVDGETVFGRIVDPDLSKMFEEKKPWFDKRTSSANWEHPLDAISLLCLT